MAAEQEITELLQQAAANQGKLVDALLPRVYEELRTLARSIRRRSPAATLDTTGLVHEAYLGINAAGGGDWPDRKRFFGYAATTMRNILVDRARRRNAQKHGAGERITELTDDAIVAPDQLPDMIELDQALSRLNELNPRLSEVVELHVFAGLTFADIADCMDLTERTVFRDWRKARAFLNTQFA